jgi:hypothetical protein
MKTAGRAGNAGKTASGRAAIGLLAAALCLSPWLASAAPDEPDAAKVREAAHSFDLGTEAYDAGRFEDAAARFEAADDLAPSAFALKGALAARAKAGQGDRAATLAAQAQRRYPDDAGLAKLARDTLARFSSSLHRIDVTCSRECVLASNARAVPGPASKEWVLFAEPGKVSVSASFTDGASADKQSLSTKAGGKNALHFMPRPTSEQPVEPTEKPSKPAATTAPSDGTAESPSETPPADGEPGEVPPADDKEGSSGWSPAVFIVGLGATAVLGGITIWSGVDTLNNPGADAVREACRGLGETCPEYEQGLANETRTNALIGVTAGVGVLTAIVGLFLTDWGGSDDAAAETEASARNGVRVMPARDGTIGIAATF